MSFFINSISNSSSLDFGFLKYNPIFLWYLDALPVFDINPSNPFSSTNSVLALTIILPFPCSYALLIPLSPSTIPPVGKSGPLTISINESSVQFGESILLIVASITSPKLCGGIFVAYPADIPLDWHDPKSGELSSGYREKGYTPEAVVNILALLGWNPGTEQEILSMEELIKLFNIAHISKSGAKFNVEKAKWFNHEYLQMKSDEEIAQMLIPQLKEHNIDAEHDYVVKVCGMMKERINFPSELWDTCCYFFEAPKEYDPAAIKKRWKSGMTTHMNKVIEILETVPFEYETLHKEILDNYIVGNQYNMGQIMNSLRLAVVGKTVGPDMLTLVMMLGKEETIARVKRAIETIGEVE